MAVLLNVKPKEQQHLSYIKLWITDSCESCCCVKHDALTLTWPELHIWLCIKLSPSLFLCSEVNLIG